MKRKQISPEEVMMLTHGRRIQEGEGEGSQSLQEN